MTRPQDSHLSLGEDEISAGLRRREFVLHRGADRWQAKSHGLRLRVTHYATYAICVHFSDD